HRQELTQQNITKFTKVVPGAKSSLFTADTKSFSGQVVFATVQTLSRPDNLAKMPPLDFIVVDEAHHVPAPSYQRIIARARELNPDVLILGVTATPNRADRKSLRCVFDNLGDQITVAELIASGHLVPPRTFVMDVGTQADLEKVPEIDGEY